MNNLRRLATSQIEVLIGVFATALIATGLLLYAFNEPARTVFAQSEQQSLDIDHAMTVFAENCSVCHGLAGEGIGATPGLDNAALRESDPDSLEKIIARGLYGTAMPAWHEEDGGPLSDYVIGELVTLIRFGDWQKVQDRVVNLGLAPLVPFTAEADPLLLQEVTNLPNGDVLALGVTVYAANCVACHGSDGLGTAIAPALNDPAIRQVGETELERTVLYGVSGTLMAGWEKALSAEEQNAVITLLQRWDEVPDGTIPTPEQKIPVTVESLALGQELYSANCSRCHGPEGQGTPRAPAINVKGFLESTPDSAIQSIITLGIPGTAMPTWGDRLTEAQIHAITGFIRQWEPTAPEVAQPARGGGPWWQSGTGSTTRGPVWRSNNNASGTALPATESNTPTATTAVLANGSGSAVAGQVGASSGTEPGAANHSGGGPPWASQTPQTQNGWEALDIRILALGSGIFAGALLMISIGLLILFKPAGSQRAGQVSEGSGI